MCQAGVTFDWTLLILPSVTDSGTSEVNTECVVVRVDECGSVSWLYAKMYKSFETVYC